MPPPTLLPLLATLLLSPPLTAATTQATVASATVGGCAEHTSCLYVATCFGNDNSTGLGPDVQAFPTLPEAVKMKSDCPQFGFVSTLSILSTSPSSMNISFESDLRTAGFSLGSPTGTSPRILIRQKPEDKTGVQTEYSGLNSVQLETKVMDQFGRFTYSFRAEARSFLPLFTEPVHFLLDDQTYKVDATQFQADLKKNLACDPTLIIDGYNDANDNGTKVLVSAHSVNCTHGSQLQWLQSDGKYKDVESAVCLDEQWTLKVDGKAVPPLPTGKINVECALEPEDDETTDPAVSLLDPHTERPVNPAAQGVMETTTKSVVVEARKEQKGTVLPGSKWVWIGGGALIFFMIVSVNIVGCLFCRRKKNSTTKKDKKTKRSKKSKKSKKGGKTSKRHSDSSNQPSSSESKDDPKKPLNISNPMPPSDSDVTLAMKADGSGGCATEANLDMLKTEMIK